MCEHYGFRNRSNAHIVTSPFAFALCVRVCACVRACVRARVRACVRACNVCLFSAVTYRGLHHNANYVPCVHMAACQV